MNNFFTLNHNAQRVVNINYISTLAVI